MERLALVRREFRSALLLGAADPDWAVRLREVAEAVEVFDPGGRLAADAGGRQSDELDLPLQPGSKDLILAVGTLDTANRLPDVLLRLRLALRPDGLLLGALPGGETIAMLRTAMRAADSLTGRASPHAHPRIDPASLANLLASAGFAMPVVDVDRVQVRYRSMAQLVRDLRRMAATNVLRQRSRTFLGKAGLEAAQNAFAAAGGADGTLEIFDVLHFAAWAPEDVEALPPPQG